MSIQIRAVFITFMCLLHKQVSSKSEEIENEILAIFAISRRETCGVRLSFSLLDTYITLCSYT